MYIPDDVIPDRSRMDSLHFLFRIGYGAKPGEVGLWLILSPWLADTNRLSSLFNISLFYSYGYRYTYHVYNRKKCPKEITNYITLHQLMPSW